MLERQLSWMWYLEEKWEVILRGIYISLSFQRYSIHFTEFQVTMSKMIFTLLRYYTRVSTFLYLLAPSPEIDPKRKKVNIYDDFILNNILLRKMKCWQPPVEFNIISSFICNLGFLKIEIVLFNRCLWMNWWSL